MGLPAFVRHPSRRSAAAPPRPGLCQVLAEDVPCGAGSPAPTDWCDRQCANRPGECAGALRRPSKEGGLHRAPQASPPRRPSRSSQSLFADSPPPNDRRVPPRTPGPRPNAESARGRQGPIPPLRGARLPVGNHGPVSQGPARSAPPTPEGA